MHRSAPTQERNPFSDTASLVLRTALSHPSKAWGVRELGRLAGVSPALAALVLKRLELLGHVSREATAQARLLDPAALLRDWAAWYAVKPLKSFRYAMDPKLDVLGIMRSLRKHRARLPGQWALTSMAGASLAAPHAHFNEVHVHLPKAESHRRIWEKVLGLDAAPRGPLHLVQPYYADAAAEGIRELAGLPVVSDAQLYLDCYRYPVRGREQAEHLLSRVIMPRPQDAR